MSIVRGSKSNLATTYHRFCVWLLGRKKYTLKLVFQRKSVYSGLTKQWDTRGDSSGRKQEVVAQERAAFETVIKDSGKRW